jgi:hypothetical protein
MPNHSFIASLTEVRQRVREHFRDAQTYRSELIEIRAHSSKAIAQSRELMTRVDALLTLPYVNSAFRRSS